MSALSVTLAPEWVLPDTWASVDFISDLHLQAREPLTTQAWEDYLQGRWLERPDALFILGDLFEVWIGDDLLNSPTDRLPAESADEAEFLRGCASQLKAFGQRTPVFFVHGNRDFLLGEVGADRLGFRCLPDPSLLVFQQRRYLISHGDALCLDDTDYQRFRQQVRSASWQTQFLQQPLAQRAQQAAAMRQHSQMRKQQTAHEPERWADVDARAARQWLQDHRATTLIHGHTHRPADHDLGDGLRRCVLSDWDLAAQPPRAQVLRLDRQGERRWDWAPSVVS